MPSAGGGRKTSYAVHARPVCGIYIYMYHMFITRRVHGRFYGPNLKKEMVVLENLP